MLLRLEIRLTTIKRNSEGISNILLNFMRSEIKTFGVNDIIECKCEIGDEFKINGEYL